MCFIQFHYFQTKKYRSLETVLIFGECLSDCFKGELINRDNTKAFRNEYDIRHDHSSDPNKKFDVIFEDDIWCLFKDMGFSELNRRKSPDCVEFKIRYGKEDDDFKQIDVFAKEENEAFIIECKSSETGGALDYHKVLNEYNEKKQGLTKYIRNYYNNTDIRVHYIIWTLNCPKPGKKERRKGKKVDISILNDDHYSFFLEVIEAMGDSSQFTLFSIIAQGKEFGNDPIVVEAIRGMTADYAYFMFNMKPIDLLRIAYVHHRNPIQERAYQRMMQKAKINSINTFLNDSTNFFGNNIIINFSEDVEFLPRKGTLSTGLLEIPNLYASVWIIDGQHRLFGYAKNTRKMEDYIPVLAFKDLSENKQGELFVTINKNQKAVDANLLWDIYGEMYKDAPENKDKYHRCLISNVVKDMNKKKSWEKVDFYGRIKIPSHQVNRDDLPHLTMTTICSALLKTKLLHHQDGILRRGDELKEIVKFAETRIRWFFEAIMESSYDNVKRDWEQKDEGFIFSNNGIVVIIYVLNHILRDYKTDISLSRDKFKERSQQYLDPLLQKFNNMTDYEIEEWKVECSSEGVRKTKMYELLMVIEKSVPGFAREEIKKWQDKKKK